jgi:hypothetical protein
MDAAIIKQAIAQLQQGLDALTSAVGGEEGMENPEGAAPTGQMEPPITEDGSTPPPPEEGADAGMSALAKFHSQPIKRKM